MALRQGPGTILPFDWRHDHLRCRMHHPACHNFSSTSIRGYLPNDSWLYGLPYHDHLGHKLLPGQAEATCCNHWLARCFRQFCKRVSEFETALVSS